LVWVLDSATMRRMTLIMPPDLVRGRATRAARAANVGPVAATHIRASATVNSRASPSDTTLWSLAARAAKTRSRASVERTVHASLRILEYCSTRRGEEIGEAKCGWGLELN
jgi:hypothetical protein